MKIYKQTGRDYQEGPVPYLDFSQYLKTNSLSFLYGCDSYHIDVTQILNNKTNIFLELEQPNSWWALSNPINYINCVDKVFTICPYTAKWLNKQLGQNIFTPIMYPINSKYNETSILRNVDKDIDVFYSGGLYNQDHYIMLEHIKNFKYKYLFWNNDCPYVTDINTNYINKIMAIARSKISICYNLLYPNVNQIWKVKQFKGWQDNEAFSEIYNGIVPQFKSRVTEAALNKSLILIKKDPWNVIEKFLTPNEDFIYFNDSNNLTEIIQNILNNYEYYENIVNNAFVKVFNNYTSEKFYEKYVKEYDV